MRATASDPKPGPPPHPARDPHRPTTTSVDGDDGEAPEVGEGGAGGGNQEQRVEEDPANLLVQPGGLDDKGHVAPAPATPAAGGVQGGEPEQADGEEQPGSACSRTSRTRPAGMRPLPPQPPRSGECRAADPRGSDEAWKPMPSSLCSLAASKCVPQREQPRPGAAVVMRSSACAFSPSNACMPTQ